MLLIFAYYTNLSHANCARNRQQEQLSIRQKQTCINLHLKEV